MKRAGVCVALVALALAAGGCGESAPPVTSPGAPAASGDLSVEVIEVNGRKVSCVVFRATSKGGVSCDFTREATPK